MTSSANSIQRRVAGRVAILLVSALVPKVLPAAEGSAEPTVKILTFNIMWEEAGIRAGNRSLPVWDDRKQLVADLILATKADIVGFQEASPEQQEGLRKLLPEYALVHHEATNNTNPLIYRTDRFRLLDSGAFVLNERPESEGTNVGVRGSTWVHLEDRQGGRRFHVYSLHLDHRSRGPARQISAVRLVERMTAHGGEVLVTGDPHGRD
jgi:endonuclease/exonuclease/phosphatase family metal-dependent hydrolase